MSTASIDRSSARLNVEDRRSREIALPTAAQTLIACLRVASPATAEHAATTGLFSRRMALVLGLHGEAAAFAQLCGALHEIGLLVAPDAPAESMRRAHAGADVLARIPELAPCAVVIASYRLRFDGASDDRDDDATGGPSVVTARRAPGCDGRDAVAREARIVAVADAFDAMLRGRSGQSVTPRRALAALEAGAGKRWDPECVHALTMLLTEPETAERLDSACAHRFRQVS